MMRKLIVIGCLMISATLQAQEEKFRLEFFGGDQTRYYTGNFIETTDGNYLGLMSFSDYNIQEITKYLLEITPAGDTTHYLQPETADSSINRYKIMQVQSNPNRYLISGGKSHSSNIFIEKDLFLLLDEHYEVIWEKQFDLYQEDMFADSRDLLLLKDSSILLIKHPHHLEKYTYAFRMSKDGDSLQFMEYTGDSAGNVESLTYNPDSTAIWWHSASAYFDPNLPNGTIVALDSMLQVDTFSYYPRWLVSRYDARMRSDGHLLTSGMHNEYYPPPEGYIYSLGSFLFDDSLNLITEAHSFVSDTSIEVPPYAMDYYYEDQIYTAGAQDNDISIFDENQVWIVVAKYDDSLNLIYEKYLGGDYNYKLSSTTATSDSGVLLCITKFDYTLPITRLESLIIKLGPEGVWVNNNENTAPFPMADAIVYPNPVSHTLYLRTGIFQSDLFIYQTNGQLRHKQSIMQGVNSIDMSTFSPAVYTWVLQQQNKIVASGKFIKH